MSDNSPSDGAFIEVFEPGLVQASERFPKRVRFRAQNALEHTNKALTLFAIDREMASFRAITGEEEAAAALFAALQNQRYPNAELLRLRDHDHKAAVLPFVFAVRNTLGNGLNVRVTLDPKKPRLDVHFPLSNFGIEIPEIGPVALTPVEPLDLQAMIPGEPGKPDQPNEFARELSSIAKGANFSAIRELVRTTANSRNTLLYASDSGLPASKATETDILRRKKHVIMLLLLTVAVLQTPIHQGLAVRGIEVLLQVLKRLPKSSSPSDG